MIIKSYEISKVNLNKIELILLYGKNEGLKSKITNDILNSKDEIIVLDEKETTYWIQHFNIHFQKANNERKIIFQPIQFSKQIEKKEQNILKVQVLTWKYLEDIEKMNQIIQ